MDNICFPFVELPAARSQKKPRQSGLTMIADWGMALGEVEDLMKLAGVYADFVKIVTGTARLYPRDYLQAKLEVYAKAGLRPFIGGQFVEYVFAEQGRRALAAFFKEARDVGFATIEVSDNCLPLNDSERRSIIQEAVSSGLSVMGEVGSKDESSDVAVLVRQAEVCFESGAEFVLVEAAELVDGGAINLEMIEALRQGLDLKRVMIELPGPWISGVTLSQIEDRKKVLVVELGPDVNLANVKPHDLIATEALRVGLGVVGPKQRRVVD
ncbi:MAG: phosphosulfolactate synthase [Pseudomonadota bacterium]